MSNEAVGEWWPVDSYASVSVGAQVVGDRWNLLIVRELLDGATGFNQIHRNLPGLSRSLLASRLRRLETLGLVRRLALGRRGTPVQYSLAPAGAALSDIIDALGAWARDWQLQPAKSRQSDSPTALWRLFSQLDTNALPLRGVHIEFQFPDATPARGWIRADRGGAARAGLNHPDGAADLVVTVAPRVLEELCSGVRQCDPTIASGDIAFDGPPAYTRDFRRWFSNARQPLVSSPS